MFERTLLALSIVSIAAPAAAAEPFGQTSVSITVPVKISNVDPSFKTAFVACYLSKIALSAIRANYDAAILASDTVKTPFQHVAIVNGSGSASISFTMTVATADAPSTNYICQMLGLSSTVDDPFPTPIRSIPSAPNSPPVYLTSGPLIETPNLQPMTHK